MRVRRAFSIALAAVLLAVSLLGNALTFYFLDGQQDLSFGDALWYSIVSVTTIGYGDYSATTTAARWGTVVFIVLFGLGTFSAVLGFGIDWASELIEKGRTGMSEIYAANHIIIVNFPSETRVTELIEELKSHPDHQSREIVVVSDRVEKLPFDDKDVLFVHGPILQQQTYRRAKLDEARMVIVLATSYDDPNSDAIVASAVAVVESLNRDVYSVAECLNYNHRMLFDSVHTNALVFSMYISGSLLSLEAHDTGVSELVNKITSSRDERATLFSVELDGQPPEAEYRDLAKRLLDEDIHLLGVLRNGESTLTFGGMRPQKGDRLLYIGPRRLNWQALLRAE